MIQTAIRINLIITQKPINPRSPSKAEVLYELLAIKDFFSLIYPRTKRTIAEHANSNKHIVMFPGYGTDNRYLGPLSRFLERHGHEIYDWGLGMNDAGLRRNFQLSDISDSWEMDPEGKAGPITLKEMGVPYLCTRAKKRVMSLSETINEPIVLVGWSLGGYIAREVARDLPKHVSHVITFGTPTIGGPKYTAAADSFRKNCIDLDWIERETLKRDDTPIEQAITIITAKYDGVVAKSACGDSISTQATFKEVNCCHAGLGFHYPLWKILLEALSNN
jgi:pimeloyl-ACP methyl ester carboxylesterase